MKEFTIQLEDERDVDMLRQLLAEVEFHNGADIQEREIDEVDGYIRFAIHPQQHLMRQESAAFDTQHEELKRRYLNQFVAMQHGKVIDFDADVSKLMERIQDMYPDQIVLIRQVKKRLDGDLIIRSPRLEPIAK